MLLPPRQLRNNCSDCEEKTEQYCVVMQTLVHPPSLQTEWVVTIEHPAAIVSYFSANIVVYHGLAPKQSECECRTPFVTWLKAPSAHQRTRSWQNQISNGASNDAAGTSAPITAGLAPTKQFIASLGWDSRRKDLQSCLEKQNLGSTGNLYRTARGTAVFHSDPAKGTATPHRPTSGMCLGS